METSQELVGRYNKSNLRVIRVLHQEKDVVRVLKICI